MIWLYEKGWKVMLVTVFRPYSGYTPSELGGKVPDQRHCSCTPANPRWSRHIMHEHLDTQVL